MNRSWQASDPLRRIALAAGVLALAGLVAVATVSAGTPFGAVDPAILSRMQTSSGSFPATAARIGTHVVTGVALGHLVAEIQANARPRTVSVSDAAAEALQRMRSRWAMVDEAARRGITVSDTEVTSYLEAQVANAEHGTAEQRSAFASVLAANGEADASAYVDDPRVRAYTHDSLMMRDLIERLLSANPKFDWQAMQAQLAAKMPVETFYHSQP
ncbi:MAG TPA: hypothetical protein VFW92_01200 [Candidatus Limnocylindrales bacterium]|nr:hypothetical protein [Candidatus Limnocylindrales bacterium]